jgi:hypothetical protein
MAEVKLNWNETIAIRTICDDCDELDGYGFNRPSDVVEALMEALDLPNKKAAGAYMTDLEKKGLIDINTYDDEIWVNPDVFEKYCSWC